MKSPLAESKCERCGAPFRSRTKGGRDRYCPPCRKEVRTHLEAIGYLQAVPRSPGARDADRRQAQSGEPSPWSENAVRALEDGRD